MWGSAGVNAFSPRDPAIKSNGMKKTVIFYGSTTGTCEDLANRLAGELGVEAKSAAEFSADAAGYDVLVLGTSTWGEGEVQDDWYGALDTLKSLNLAGKTVALFGCGDSSSYPDSFCGGMKALYDAAVEAGATVLEGPSADGYSFSSSEAVVDGKFVGVALDELNEPEKTDERLAPMIEAVKNL